MFSGCREPIRPRLLAGLFLCCLLAAGPVLAAPGSGRILRVAADPNNLPFSNDRLEGLENRLAALIAEGLGARVEYMWWPQRRGFFRETLGSGRADVVMGVPAGFERVLTTRPYYRSTYVFVQPAAARPVHSFDDPVLRTATIGVQLAGDDGINTPPAHALAARGIVENVRGYTLFGDYGEADPPSAIIRAVATHAIDLAVAWGPMAGYFAARQDVPLAIVPVEPCDCPSLQFVFAIAVGVAYGQPELRDEIDEILARQSGAVTRILDEFGVPRVAAAPRGKEVSRAEVH